MKKAFSGPKMPAQGPWMGIFGIWTLVIDMWAICVTCKTDLRVFWSDYRDFYWFSMRKMTFLARNRAQSRATTFHVRWNELKLALTMSINKFNEMHQSFMFFTISE